MSPDKKDPENDSPRVIAGRYKIISKIGEGGAGEVYKAYDQTLKRHLAIKTLHIIKQDDKRLLRFQREAKAASKLAHEGLVEVYDFGCADDGTPYLVMELVEGKPLSAVLKDHGRLEVRKALDIAIQTAAAMQNAHNHKVIHRDLKPGNILVTESKDAMKIKIIDFGLATVLENRDAGKTLTPRHAIAGSPNYMSPEQIEHKEIDERTDIYSLGCILFELIAGVPPFKSDTMMETLENQAKTAPPAMIEVAPELQVPNDVQHVIYKMLAKEPGQRYASMNAVKESLGECLVALLTSDVQEKPQEAPAGSDVLSRVGLGITMEMGKDKADLNDGTPKEKSKNKQLAIACGGALILILTIVVGTMMFNPVAIPGKKKEFDLNEEAQKHILKEEDKPVSDDLDTLMNYQDGNQHGENLSRLRIQNNNFSREGLIKLVETNKSLEIVELFDTAKMDDQMLAILARSRSIRCLEVGRCPNVTDKMLDSFVGVSLKEIKLRQLNITDKISNTIARIRPLEQLWLSHNSAITAKAIKPLTELPFLYVLGVGNTQIKGKDFLALRQLKRLRVLAFEDCTLSDEDARYISELKFVQGIWLTRGKLTEKGFEYITSLPLLDHLRVRRLRGVSQKTIELFRARVGKRCNIEVDYMPEPFHVESVR